MHTNPEILALLALGEDVGSSSDRAHIATCDACASEVAELTALADASRLATPFDALSRPGPQVWERVQAELGFAAAAGPKAGLGLTTAGDQGGSAPGAPRGLGSFEARPPLRRGSSAGRRYLALTLAAALALVVGIGVGIGYESRVNRPRERVIARAELTAFPKWQGATGTAEVSVDGTGKRTLILRMASPAPIIGTAEVWLADRELTKMNSMGPMTGPQTSFEIPPGMSLFTFSLVDISDEPPNDPSADHSGDSILRGQLE